MTQHSFPQFPCTEAEPPSEIPAETVDDRFAKHQQTVNNVKIDIKAVGIAVDPDMCRFVRRCSEAAFSVHRDQIVSLRIRLAEVNRARDGKSQSCLVQVGLSRRHRLNIEVMDSDLRVAIHRAVDRAGWTVSRWLQRRERQSGQLTIVGHHTAGYPEPEQAA